MERIVITLSHPMAQNHQDLNLVPKAKTQG